MTLSPLRTGLAAAALISLATASTAGAVVVDDPVSLTAPGAALALTPLGTYETGIFDESAAEIVEHYAAAQRLLVINAAEAKVEVLDVADPAAPTKLFDLQTVGVPAADGSIVPAGATANSVAVRPDGLGVVAVESDPKTDAGWLVFFDAGTESGTALGAVRVGAQPDMVTITPDGTRAVVADEGEPADDYSVDPEGTVAVVGLPATVTAPAQSAVRLADFHAFEGAALHPGIRVFGGRADAGTGTPEFPVSENLEPEYVAIDQQSKTAYVTLQEANGIAVVDLRAARVTAIRDLGTIDRRVVPFDPSDRDGDAIIGTWPVTSFRMPDAIASYRVHGTTYLVTANEGDSRDWSEFSEVVRVKDLGTGGRQPLCAGSLSDLQADARLGRLNVTAADGLDATGTCFEQLYTFGGRGFSIFSAAGDLVFDSGPAFEQLTDAAVPGFFNSNHTQAGFDNRSDDKGPEPEGLVLGKVGGRTYAFVGLERVGGVMAYDVTDPAAPRFVTYVNNRNFLAAPESAAAGDLGPEGLTFIPAEDAPTGVPLLVVANEVSGSTTTYSVDRLRRR